MKKMVLITNVSKPQQEKERVDGKARRFFVTVTAAEAILDPATGRYHADPFKMAARNIWQVHSTDGKTTRWKQTPEQLESLMGLKLPISGEVVTKKVETFPVIGVDGKQQVTKTGQPVFASQYTTVIFGNEDMHRVFNAANHKIIDDVRSHTDEQPLRNDDLVGKTAKSELLA